MLNFLRRIWQPFNFAFLALSDKIYDDNGSITDDGDGHDQMDMVMVIVVRIYFKNEREHGHANTNSSALSERKTVHSFSENKIS